MNFPGTSLVVRRRMARIRKTDTQPELIVRKLASKLGYRFRVHRCDLPGTPDLAFPGRRKVIFVHGCFWHQHKCSLGKKQPRTRQEYWVPKLARNVERDRVNGAALRRLGWKMLVVWECQTSNIAEVSARIVNFLDA